MDYQEALSILGVSDQDSPRTIKHAYRAKALLYHPDKQANKVTIERDDFQKL